MASPISFQGLSTNLPTDQLVNAIIQQESTGLTRMQDRQTLNTRRRTALQGINSNFLGLRTSFTNLFLSFSSAQTLTSSDPNSAYVSAAVNGVPPGNYAVVVNQVATAAQLGVGTLSPMASSSATAVLDSRTLAAVASPSATGTVAWGTYAVKDRSGTVKTFTINGANDSLQGFQTAINALGGSVQATILNTGSGPNPFQLVLGSSTTGTSAGFSIARTAADPGSPAGATTLNIAAGTLVTDAGGNPIDLTGGTASLGTVAWGTYAAKDTNGAVKTFTINAGNDSLQGFADALNGLGLGVTATVMNTGSGANPYQLVVGATATGAGSAGATTFAVAQVATDPGSPAGSSAFGIAAGTLVTDAGGNPTNLTGGSSSSAAQNAQFSVNGVAFTRSSNFVTDAMPGLTLSLRQGNPAATTTFTVAPDQAAMATAASDLTAKFNAILQAYNGASAAATYNTDGTVATPAGPLNNDSLTRGLIAQVGSALRGVPSGLAAGNAYHSLAEIGFKTQRDGTLTVDASAFKAALAAHPGDVQSLLSAVQAKVNPIVDQVTSPGSGSIAQALTSIDTQNFNLTRQISSAQARLDRRRQMLMDQYANLEAVIGQLQAAGQSLGSLR